MAILDVIIVLVVVALIGLTVSVRIITQYERVVLFELGKVEGQVRRPGPSFSSRSPSAFIAWRVTRTSSGARRNATYWVLQPRPFRPGHARTSCPFHGWRSLRRR